MGWTDEWYPNALSSLCELRGRSSATDYTGAQLPALGAVETLSVLGQMSTSVIAAIIGWQDTGSREDPSSVGRWTPGTDESGYYEPLSEEVTAALSDKITVTKWLAGFAPLSGTPWARTNGTPSGMSGNSVVDSILGATMPLYSPFLVDDIKTITEPALVMTWHELIAAWDAAVKASAAGLMAAGVDIRNKVDDTNSRIFWGAVHRVCVALDTLQENPPASTYDRVKAASSVALDKTATFVGESAAQIAAKAGEIAGAAAEGFINSSTLMTVVVGALAVFLFMR